WLMADAGIVPQVAQVRSGEAELSRITGAQAPSGVPVVISTPVSELSERRKSTGSSSRGGRSRPARTRRASAAPQARTGTSPSRPSVNSAA
ncbi:ATP-dependent helicase, partial [Streptomyces sp. IB2014 016-6]